MRPTLTGIYILGLVLQHRIYPQKTPVHMTEIRSVEFPVKDRPLRDDVSVLGQLLGEVLLEQHGPELLEQVELVRIDVCLQ